MRLNSRIFFLTIGCRESDLWTRLKVWDNKPHCRDLGRITAAWRVESSSFPYIQLHFSRAEVFKLLPGSKQPESLSCRAREKAEGRGEPLFSTQTLNPRPSYSNTLCHLQRPLSSLQFFGFFWGSLELPLCPLIPLTTAPCLPFVKHWLKFPSHEYPISILSFLSFKYFFFFIIILIWS